MKTQKSFHNHNEICFDKYNIFKNFSIIIQPMDLSKSFKVTKFKRRLVNRF